MNNEVKKRPEQTPQDYGPKKPEIIDLAQQAADKIHTEKGIYTVKNKNGSIYIDGVPVLEWGKHKDNTYCGAIAAAAEIMGINVSYEILMGVSGLCYRFAMKPDWCPSAPLAQNGRVWDENINALLGISLYTVADEEERKGRIIDHLNRGLPVIGMGQMGAPEWDLFTGYTEDASIFFGRSYFDSQESLPDSPYCLDENHYYTENKYRKAENYPGMEPQVFVKFFDTACEKRPVVELLKESLEICRYYYSCEPIYGCHFGNAAYEILIKGLLEDYKDNENYHVGCLADSRLCASVYLSESVSQLKDHNNREKLLKAAALYRSIYDDIVSVTPYEVLTPTFNTGTGLPWSHDVRMTLADVLKKVMDTEAEIQKLVKDILEHWTE